MQYRLSTPLLAFVVVAMSLSVFGPWGLLVGAGLLAIVDWIRRPGPMSPRIAMVGLLLFLGLCLVGVWSACSDPPDASRRATCRNNLSQIGRALLSYEAAHGAFPPAFVTDKQGTAMHSWRALVLPYVDGALCKSYAFDQPWDSPSNKAIWRPIREYACPSDSSNWHSCGTNYLALVGPGAPWGRPLQCSLSCPAAQARIPAMVVEVADSGISWTEPRDMTLDEAMHGLNPESGTGMSSKHITPGEFFYHDEFMGAHVLFADGTVRFIPAGIPQNMLQGLLAGDPQETMALDHFQGSPNRRINWSNCAALAGLVLSVAVMLFRRRGTATASPETANGDDPSQAPS